MLGKADFSGKTEEMLSLFQGITPLKANTLNPDSLYIFQRGLMRGEMQLLSQYISFADAGIEANSLYFSGQYTQ